MASANSRFSLLIALMAGSLAISCSSTKPRPTIRSQASIPPRSSVRDQLPLIWPLASGKLSSGFLNKRKRHSHQGLDLSAPAGSKIYAPADGTVTYTGRKFRGYGKLIILEHHEGLATFFGHCSKILVREGQRVKQGALIGLVGRTGRATAPHLHFEVRVHQKPVDPVDYLP